MYTYLFVALSLIALTFIYLKVAITFNIIDKPNERSSHTIPTIRGGGIIFFLAVVIFFFTNNFQYPYFVIGVSIMAIISFVDDIITLSARIRLLFQLVGVGLLIFQTGFLGAPYALAVAILIATIGFTNIYNFMDGINGITGMNSLATLVGFLVLNIEFSIVPNDLIVIPILSVLVFGYFNFRKKARFFAGDVGSISMAMIVVFLLLVFIKKMEAPILLLLIVVYLLDGGLTILRRLVNGENIFEPHRSHLYQRMVQETKLSHLQVSGIFSTIQILMIIPILLTINEDWKIQTIVLLICLIILTITYLIIYRKINLKATKS